MTNSYDVDHGLSQDEPGPLEPVEIAEQPGAAPATGNTARDQEMYVAGIRTGEENAKHNAAIRAGAGWLPIESAPKDGTEIWAYNGEQARMRWVEGECYALWIWADDLLADADPSPEQPTYWQSVPAAPGVSTVEEKPAAYLTLDEDGSPCMLFFDVVEARAYCEVGEEPEALWRRPASAAGDAQVLEFVREVAQQKPEKPDHWSSCGQCQSNSRRGEELLDELAAQRKGDA